MTRPVHVVVLRLCAVVLSLTFATLATLAQTFTEAGFSAETVAQVTRFNTVGFTFAPDGRIFTWEKPGVVRIVKNGVLLPTPFLNLSARVNSNADSGLLGLALDPNFASNGFVYLVYVFEGGGNPSDTGPKTARLVRVKADPANPDVAQANSEVILLGKISTPPCSAGADCMGTDFGVHTIGTVRFGPDGKLYVGMGDGSAFTTEDEGSFRAQDLNYYNGKILRINPDGTAPSDNPFYDGNPNSIRSKVYAYGLRNPFRFTHKPGTGEVYIGDVGAAKFEEINRGRGANFGWPCYEGPNPQFSFQNKFPQRCAAIPASAVTFPLHSYDWNGGSAIVMGPFYTGTKYPTKFRNNLFFSDFVQGFIRRVVFDANNNVASVESFATAAGSPVHLEQGTDGFLYYMEVATGELKRIRFSGTAPMATATATRPSASTPYTVAFSSAGSVDPNNSALSYLWEFGDGTTATAANPTHTYNATGVKTYPAKLTVTNTQGLTGTDTIDVIVGGRAPVATITAPANNARIKTGTRVTFTGTVSDADETLPASAMKWSVLLHHNDHIHPGVTATDASGSFVVEDHGATNDTYFYEIVLTVTDSAGLTDTKRVNVLPERPAPPPPPTTLPAPWQAQAVGTSGVPSSASFTNGTFTLKGSGTGIGGTNDGFLYTYQTLSGDGQISARVNSVQNTAAEAIAGVMIRESLAANARHVMVRYTPGNHTAALRRTSTGGSTTTNNGDDQTLQRWVRIVRQGNNFSSYQSANGTSWQLIETVTITMPTDVVVGLAVTSANNAALCTAIFDNVSVAKPPANQPPTVNFTAPSNGATFTAPSTIRLIANAADSDGSISKVEFFHGTTLINTQTISPYDFTWSNVQPGTYTITARAFDNKGAVTISAPITITVKAASVVAGTGNGLLGEYFKKGDYKDQALKDLAATRLDPTVNFFWGEERPFDSLDKDQFAVRWRGQVQPRYSGNYTFHVRTGGGVRLWVNNKLLFDDQAEKEKVLDKSGIIALTAGQKYSIVLEFYKYNKNKKLTQIQLDWSSAQQPREVIPKSQLYAAPKGGDDDD